MKAEHTLLSDALDPSIVIPIVAPAVTFGAIIAMVAIILYFRYRAQQLRQEIYRSFIDKGEPIPPSLLPGAKRKSRHGDLRLGLFLLTGGVGLSMSLLLSGNAGAAPFGLIPGLIGLGFLVVWKVESSPDTEGASP